MRRTTRVVLSASTCRRVRPCCSYKYSTQVRTSSDNSNKSQGVNTGPPLGGLSREEIQKRVEKYYSEKEPKGQPSKREKNETTYFTQAYRRWKEREQYVPEVIPKKKVYTEISLGAGSREDPFLYQLPTKYAIRVKSKIYGRPSLSLLRRLSPTLDVTSRTLSAAAPKRTPNVFSLYPSTSTTPSSNPVTLSSYKVLFRSVRRALSDSPRLFVFDSELSGSRTRVRIITDSLSTAIWSKINLPPAPGLSRPFLTSTEEDFVSPLYENEFFGHYNWDEFKEDVLVFVTSNLSDRTIYGPETIPRATRFTSGGAAGGAKLPGKAESKGQVAVGEFYDALKESKAAGKRSKNKEKKEGEAENDDTKQKNVAAADDGNNDFVLENYQHKQVVVGLFEDSSNKLGPFVGGEQIRDSIRKVASYNMMAEDPDTFILPYSDALLINSNSSKAQEGSPDYMNGKKSVVVVDFEGNGVRSAFYNKSGDSGADLSKAQLYAGHDVVFKGDRIYPMWSGVSLNEKSGAQTGSLIEGDRVSNGLKTVFSKGAPAPEAIVFLDKEAKSGTYNKMTAEDGWSKLQKKMGEGVLGQEVKKRWDEVFSKRRILSMGVAEGGVSKLDLENVLNL